MKERILISMILSVTFLVTGISQNIKPDTLMAVELAEVSVSAVRTRLNIKDIPQSVSVISANDILGSPYDNAEDIVRNIPGIYNFRH